MPKIVNTARKAKANAWTFEGKAIGPKAKAIKFGVEAKSWPRGLHHWENERKKCKKNNAK